MHEGSGVDAVIISSLTMGIEAVTLTLQWLAFQRDVKIMHAIIVTHPI